MAFCPTDTAEDPGIDQRVAIEPTLDDHGALACGDGSERAAQSFRIQLSPHKPPADVHLERDTRGSRRHDTSNRSGAVALPTSPKRAHFVVELQLKLEFSSICGYGRLRSGAARCEGTAASYHQSREARPMANRQLRPLLLKFNRPQPVRRILRSQTGCGYGPALASWAG